MKQAITRKWLRVRISARFARAMILCFHFKLNIKYGNKQRKISDGGEIFLERWTEQYFLWKSIASVAEMPSITKQEMPSITSMWNIENKS